MGLTVILTHENADFDAVASQLAAYKLTPDAIPVLSRRLNRNVQNFITDYGDQLPFIQAADWRKREIDQLIVVDSQTYSALKGMRPTIPMRFIDHHPLANPLEAYQEYTGEPLGATVSLLVEQLQAAQITLTPIEATLFMLGIYDDTGSLIYGTTTARDLVAAAWLHEQGARLDLVRKYLERALNDEQRALYSRLIEGVEIIKIQPSSPAGERLPLQANEGLETPRPEGEGLRMRAGQTDDIIVVIATANLDHVVEEVSVLAHKVREMYEGQAVFLLVAMQDSSGKYVQMVARSAAEQLDVGEITRAFGGGGHSRAAAAQIRDMSLDRVMQRLKGMLDHGST